MKVQLSEREKVAIAAFTMLGVAGLPMCYRVVNPHSKAREDVFLRQAQRWAKSKMVQDYLNDLTSIHHETTCEGLPTKEGLVIELQKALKASQDPAERASIAIKLADLLGLKGGRENVRDEREQRRYYLPFVSKCRSCEIYQLFKKILPDGA